MEEIYTNLTEEDKKLLEQFPEYKEGGEFVGTREYWEGVFDSETNRDAKLHEDFSKLHENLVNQVIKFCKDHNLTDIGVFDLYIDGIEYSTKFGEWCPATDSSCWFQKGHNDKKFFLHEI